MPDESYYSKLLSELDAVGWDKLEFLDPSLKSLTLILKYRNSYSKFIIFFLCILS
jgi:hypothetical protein